jgi:hypothetical protein
MPSYIYELTEAEKARMGEWADRWIEIGLRTRDSDRSKFQKAVRECYRFAGLEAPKVIVWTPSPLVVALAGPVAAFLVAKGSENDDAVGDAVGDAVRDAVSYAICEAARDIVRYQVTKAVANSVDGAIGAVCDVVRDAVRDVVVDNVPTHYIKRHSRMCWDCLYAKYSISGAVDRAVSGVVGRAVDLAAYSTVAPRWAVHLGTGYSGGAFMSFFREICGLVLDRNLWDRALAYEATLESAYWWFPQKEFVMVSERPTVIHRELVTSPAGNHPQSRASGPRVHRLHCATGPACGFRDGWGVWAWHGVRVPQRVIERPEQITIGEIQKEQNVEVRRVMMGRYGLSRFLVDSGAKRISEDELGELYRIEVPNDEPLVMVKVLNSTLEQDGSRKPYFLRVPPGVTSARQAVAWTFSMTPDEYAKSLLRET